MENHDGHQKDNKTDFSESESHSTIKGDNRDRNGKKYTEFAHQNYKILKKNY